MWLNESFLTWDVYWRHKIMFVCKLKILITLIRIKRKTRCSCLNRNYPSEHAVANEITTFCLSFLPFCGCYRSEWESHPLIHTRAKERIRETDSILKEEQHWDLGENVHLCDQFSCPNEQGLWVPTELQGRESWSCSLRWHVALCAKQ